MGVFNFFDRFRAHSEDRSPAGDFWFDSVSMRSASAVRVSPDTALRLSAVYACVRILSETMASLPLIVYRDAKSGVKERVSDHWLHTLLCRRPNRYQNPFEWREMLQGHLALRGNAYNRIVSNPRGEIVELIPLHPDRVRLEVLRSGEYRYRVTDRFGDETLLPRGEVWHLRALSSDGLLGMNPIELARESLGMALAAQDYGARFFANDAKPTGGWIEFPGSFKDAEAKRVFRESYQAAQAGVNRGKVLVLESGMKFHEVGVSNKDAQFLELRKFQITDIARLFRVPPHMIGDLDRATFSNIEQQSLEFVMHTMTPWAERWEASLESTLVPEGEGLTVEFDFTNLMRGDAASRSAYYQSGIQNGWLTRNEARLAESLNPMDGLDEPLRPLNMVEESHAEQVAEDREIESAETPRPMSARAVDERFLALIHSSAHRWAKRLSRAGKIDPHDVELIAEALAVSPQRAQRWAQQRAGDSLSEARLRESLIQLGMLS